MKNCNEASDVIDDSLRMGYNLVPRVLWLFGQRMGASRDSGIMEKDNFFDWSPA